MYQSNIIAINAITSFKANLIENQLSIRGIIISNNVNEINQYKDDIQKKIEESNTLLEEYKKTITDDEDRNLTSQMESKLQDYRDIRDQILTFNLLDPKQSEKANKLLIEANDSYNIVNDVLKKMQDLNTK